MKGSVTIALACCLAIYPSIVTAAPSIAGVELWRGLRSGDTMEQVREQRPNSEQEHFSGFPSTFLNVAPQNINDADSLAGEDIFDGRPTRVAFVFKNDRLKDVILTLHDVTSDDATNIAVFDDIVKYITRIYGSASKCDRTSLPKLGTWTNYMCVWIVDNLRLDVLYLNMNRLPVLTVSYHADGSSFSNAR